MSALNKKLLRDLSNMKGQIIAIGAVVACGIAIFVASMSTVRSLENAKLDYYSQYRFAEVFATLPGHPLRWRGGQNASRASLLRTHGSSNQSPSTCPAWKNRHKDG